MCLQQNSQQGVFIEGLRETDAYPADPNMVMVGKNYLANVCVDILWKTMDLQVRVARYHNIYGPFGTYGGGREKAPCCVM